MSFTRHQTGNQGEQDIIEKVPCPSCGQTLMLLPINFPLYDVQCRGCLFRAQVKTSQSKPKSVIFGAGWTIMENVLKSGHLMPPLLVNFKWMQKNEEKQEIRFYPFVPRKNLAQYKLSANHRQANYRMFRYTGLNDLPHFVLYKK